MKANEWQDETGVLFDPGPPVAVIEPPIIPPPPKMEIPDPTLPMVFDPPLAGATISNDGIYRYILWRRLKEVGDIILWIMGNPSTADGEVDDSTLRACIDISKRQGAAGIMVVNLFAFRTKSPAILRKQKKAGVDISGPDNLPHLEECWGKCAYVICGWGNIGEIDDAGRNLIIHIRGRGKRVFALGLTKAGHPRHPLYVKRSSPLIEFKYGPAPVKQQRKRKVIDLVDFDFSPPLNEDEVDF